MFNICEVNWGVLRVAEKRRTSRYYDLPIEIVWNFKYWFNWTFKENKYREYNTNITSKLGSKKVVITFSGTFDNVYELKYKSGYLELEIDKNDAVGLNVAMVMLDSVAVYYGEEETSTYDTFKSNRIYDMNLNDGVKVIINSNTYVYRISLNNHIK